MMWPVPWHPKLLCFSSPCLACLQSHTFICLHLGKISALTCCCDEVKAWKVSFLWAKMDGNQLSEAVSTRTMLLETKKLLPTANHPRRLLLPAPINRCSEYTRLNQWVVLCVSGSHSTELLPSEREYMHFTLMFCDPWNLSKLIRVCDQDRVHNPEIRVWRDLGEADPSYILTYYGF